MKLQALRERFEARLDEALNGFVEDIETQYDGITSDEAHLIGHLLNMLDRGMESDTISNLFQQEHNEDFERRMLEASQSLAERY